MTVSPFPIGRLLVVANNQKDFISKNSLENSINNIVDLIKLRSTDHSLENVATGLLSELFDLRLDLLEYLATKGSQVNDYLRVLDEEIAENSNANKFSDLSIAIASALENYSKIVSPITQKIGLENFAQLLESIEEGRPNYEMVKLFSFHPSPQIRLMKNWIDSSLAFEVGLIVSDLVLTGKLNIAKSKINVELIDFITNSLTRFGAYSIFTGFWTPDISDNSHLINKMRILNSTLELENGKYSKLSEQGLSSLINN